ncbi:hypothetical protein H696_01800 [Fonticula alba]|uniref:Sugar phosphate transporter domain-containing protein n=1 Tax=Fonticula alba TaxID=691883 RepID=A0A058ZDE0_FONAL|nr:hypothetical protein H696_01800 [Fonticula alba]KCV72404.1 hypothetical protein H696_01800 [Fonticula alba]|eukprot:XP_009493982.1 hypothetical protein H696_01800 [Fonticula alba]
MAKNLSSPASASAWGKIEPAVALASYFIISILMTLLNKLVVARYVHGFHLTLLATQNFTCTVLLLLAKFFGIVNFRSLTMTHVKLWMPLVLLVVIMLYTGTKSLQHLSIHVFTIFKNLAIIFVAYGEKVIFRSKVTPMMLVSFALMVFSAIAAAGTDLTFDLVGYSWMISNGLASAVYTLSLRSIITRVRFADLDSVFYNNMLSWPVMATGGLLLEFPAVVEFFKRPDWGLGLFWIITSGAMSFFIGYCSIWCIRCTSSTTHSMAGALNKLPPPPPPPLIFDRDAVTVGTVLSIILGFISGLVYTQARLNMKKEADNTISTKPSGLMAPSSGNPLDISKSSIEGSPVLPLAKALTS